MNEANTSELPGELMDAVIGLSHHYGANPDYVLAGGGNTSVKTERVIWVKCSGTALATITADQFVALDRARVAQTVSKDYDGDPFAREDAIKNDLLNARLYPERGRRPSVEAVLHNLLDRTFVVHLHPYRVNGITCAVDGEAVIGELFGESAVWVPYTDPGCQLSKAVANILDGHPIISRADPIILILQNHGIFIAANTPSELSAAYDSVFETIDAYYASHDIAAEFASQDTVTAMTPRAVAPDYLLAVAPAIRGALTVDGVAPIVRAVSDPMILKLLNVASGCQLAAGGAVTPDQIVYCKSFPVWVDYQRKETPRKLAARVVDAIKQYRAAHPYDPKVVLIPGVGAWTLAETIPAARVVESVYADAVKVYALAQGSGGVKYFDERERVFIETWEVEQYRRKVLAASASSGRMAGKTAIVTGAAQGFGLGLADGLARHGATVCIADMNAGGAVAAAEMISKKYGESRAIHATVDVADEASVAEMVQAAVREFGGCDIFISNAGVLRAGSVKDMPGDVFRFVTDVNYIGYFHCVKHIAPVMAAQTEQSVGGMCDVIQINSKSGLAGSNKNAAYAGAKFGSVGLTQSFALELVADRIKVNAVCPGNFFDGPLWSDPETGLFVQYLKAGKVDGAESVDDVRASYENKVPMKRGCMIKDVLAAVLYLVEQQYETGQALPVTGGQVMLH